VGEPHARRRIGNTNQVMTGRALDLPTCMMCLALQGLVTMVAVELEFVGVHKLLPDHAQKSSQKYMEDLFILFDRQMRM
jgi:hypothetical protein